MQSSRIISLALAGFMSVVPGCFNNLNKQEIPIVFGANKIDYDDEVIDEVIKKYGFSKCVLSLEYSYRKHNDLEAFFEKNSVKNIYSDLESLIDKTVKNVKETSFEHDYEIIPFITKKLHEEYSYSDNVLYFSKGLVEGKLDCNLYCYIIYDIIKKSGKNIDINLVAAPNHVFLMFKTNDTENPYKCDDDYSYFETVRNSFYIPIAIDDFKKLVKPEDSQFYMKKLTLKQAYSTILFEVAVQCTFSYDEQVSTKKEVNLEKLSSLVYLFKLSSYLSYPPENRKFTGLLRDHLENLRSFLDELMVE